MAKFILSFILIFVMVTAPYGQTFANFLQQEKISCCASQDSQDSGENNCCDLEISLCASTEESAHKDQHSSEKSTNDHHNCDDCAKNCTGNCTQNGCHSSNITLKFVAVEKFFSTDKWVNESSKTLFFGHKSLCLQEPAYSIWQPPKIV